MIRVFPSGILVACVLAGLSAAAQQPTFRGTADNVRVFTTVTDRDGRLVTTLEQKDVCSSLGSRHNDAVFWR